VRELICAGGVVVPRERRGAAVVSAVVALGLSAALLVMWTAPAAAVVVDDEAAFRAAWSNPTETRIDLATDITLTCGGGGTAQRESTGALTIDGHGHNITQTCANHAALASPLGVSMFRNVTVTDDDAPDPAGGRFGQSMTVEVRRRHQPRRHQPRPHQPPPVPAAPVPARPMLAVVRFTG